MTKKASKGKTLVKGSKLQPVKTLKRFEPVGKP